MKLKNATIATCAITIFILFASWLQGIARTPEQKIADHASAIAFAMEIPARERMVTIAMGTLFFIALLVLIAIASVFVRYLWLRSHMVRFDNHIVHKSEFIVQPLVVKRASELKAIPEPSQAVLALPAPEKYIVDNKQTTREKIYVGKSQVGDEYTDIQGILSTYIVGRPGNGKSNLMKLIAAQAEKIGAEVVAWDIHAKLNEDLKGIKFSFKSGVQEIDDSAFILENKLDRRIRSSVSNPPILLVIDEIQHIANACPRAMVVVERIISEGRKFNMFIVMGGTNMRADFFLNGQSTIANFSSVFFFQTLPDVLKPFGIQKDWSSTVGKLQVGQAIWLHKGDAKLIAIPLCEKSSYAEFSYPLSEPGKRVKLYWWEEPDAETAEIMRSRFENGASINDLVKEFYRGKGSGTTKMIGRIVGYDEEKHGKRRRKPTRSDEETN